MILLDTAAHWSRVDLQRASHLLFSCAATSALETGQASKASAIEMKRTHSRRQNMVLIAAGPLALGSHRRRVASTL